jgi:hypothetical protein
LHHFAKRTSTTAIREDGRRVFHENEWSAPADVCAWLRHRPLVNGGAGDPTFVPNAIGAFMATPLLRPVRYGAP